MKKNYWLIAIFLLMGGATALYFVFGHKAEKSTLGWDRNFKVKLEDVHKIFIAKRTNGETFTLERSGKTWTVNGQWEVSAGAIDNLLEVVTSIELKFVPAAQATDNVVKELGSRGIKVEIYDRSGDKLKTYYIGGVTADARATYAIQEGSEQPMAVCIPQMDGQIRSRFDLTLDDWRSRELFNYTPEQIQAVSVEYPQQRSKSFRLQRQGSGFEVKPFYDNVPPINGKVQNGRVEGYLINFDGLLAESFSNNYAEKDSVRQMMPFSVVTLTDLKGQEKKVAFYPTYRTDTQTGERRSDIVERYFADVSTGDWMLTQHRVFEKIFWPYDAFFQPVKPVSN